MRLGLILGLCFADADIVYAGLRATLDDLKDELSSVGDRVSSVVPQQ